MKKSFQFLIGFVLLFMAFGCGANNATEVSTITYTPLPTQTPTATPTTTPKPTNTTIPTQAPVFVNIGSPFPQEWGTPRIWSNDAYNAPWIKGKSDMYHGHMDVAVPKGYSHYDGFDLDNHAGDVLAPVSGYIERYEDNSEGLHLFLSKNTYLSGILEALKFSGVENPSLTKISKIWIDLGHVKDVRTGEVVKGDVIAEIDPKGFNYQNQYYESGVAFKVYVTYAGIDYALTPTLFTLDKFWECHPNSKFDCEPEPNDYAP